ncbi:hypothetical protein MTR67_048033 [Solanum verrucosum]|uniref:Uncharacterized protein n=1 Tax=Solanum verrucosum TaxID=315347 RepID=A0AAF0ZYT1_SOLVR|nr:hypothetical protein MTR67_048033 [Solanum verrucosum]
MAENASTVFNVHVPEFVDAIWVALRDPTVGTILKMSIVSFLPIEFLLTHAPKSILSKEVEPDVIFILIGLREIKDIRLFNILDNSQVFLPFQPLKEGAALALRQLVEEETRDLSGVPRILFRYLHYENTISFSVGGASLVVILLIVFAYSECALVGRTFLSLLWIEESKQWKKMLLPSSMFHVPEFVDAIWVALCIQCWLFGRRLFRHCVPAFLLLKSFRHDGVFSALEGKAGHRTGMGRFDRVVDRYRDEPDWNYRDGGSVPSRPTIYRDRTGTDRNGPERNGMG